MTYIDDYTVTAKRAVIVSFYNQSSLTLDKPEWVMKHGHAASDGLPPEEIKPGSSESGIPVAFVKPRVSAYGCAGVLLYRYDDCVRDKENPEKDPNYSKNCFFALKFTIPTAGQNKCAIAILSHKDCKETVNVYDSFFSKDPKLYNYIKEKNFKPENKSKDISEMKSKSGKWMEVRDKRNNVIFGCTMSGEDNAMIRVKISNI